MLLIDYRLAIGAIWGRGMLLVAACWRKGVLLIDYRSAVGAIWGRGMHLVARVNGKGGFWITYVRLLGWDISCGLASDGMPISAWGMSRQVFDSDES